MIKLLNNSLNLINRIAPVYSQQNINRSGVVSFEVKKPNQILLE